MAKTKKNIIALIPARAGSRGIAGKNIVDLGGHPLIAYSIAAARMSKIISRVIVSTDSEDIVGIAKRYGAEAPFLRPERFARDFSPDIEFVLHAVKWLKENENYRPDYIVHLRPTTPLREPEVIDEAIGRLMENQEATSLRSAHELSESPHKFFEIKNGFFAGLFSEDSLPDHQNMARQAFPPAYHPNGYVDVIKTKTIEDTGAMHGLKILPFITQFTVELDKIGDLDYIKFDLARGKYKIAEFLENRAKNYGKI